MMDGWIINIKMDGGGACKRMHAAARGRRFEVEDKQQASEEEEQHFLRVPADSLVFVLLSALFPQARWDYRISSTANVFAFQRPKVLQSLFNFNGLGFSFFFLMLAHVSRAPS